jgi:hypothetical protein
MATTTPVAKATGSTPGLIRTFLLDHERLIIVVILACAMVWGYGKYADIRAAHDNATLQAQVLVTNQAKAASDAQAAQAVQDKAALQALTDKLTAQNQQLANANTALTAALANQKKSDATIPLPELDTRWASLVPGVSAADVTLSPTGLVQVPQADARATVEKLEEVPVLAAELANETTLEKNDQLVIGQQTKNIFDLNTQVTGLQTLQADKDKQCTDQINVVKAQAKKSKIRWFKIGFVAGFVTRQVIKMETGW